MHLHFDPTTRQIVQNGEGKQAEEIKKWQQNQLLCEAGKKHLRFHVRPQKLVLISFIYFLTNTLICLKAADKYSAAILHEYLRNSNSVAYKKKRLQKSICKIFQCCLSLKQTALDGSKVTNENGVAKTCTLQAPALQVRLLRLGRRRWWWCMSL